MQSPVDAAVNGDLIAKLLETRAGFVKLAAGKILPHKLSPAADLTTPSRAIIRLKVTGKLM